MTDKVHIRHAESGLEADVVETAVPAWTAHGWTVVEDEDSEKPQASQAAPTNGPAAPDTV